ncbi:hypothetical protein ACFOZ7_12180 [Natribaculum luteum]|uniref:Uncharacterized protein n=1 Tax=Natribaculum luteum TaxID=1586232 RepID=A0ABD5P0Z3_9EURY|nr:hypothetical protein [Natribaculum luteum]
MISYDSIRGCLSNCSVAFSYLFKPWRWMLEPVLAVIAIYGLPTRELSVRTLGDGRRRLEYIRVSLTQMAYGGALLRVSGVVMSLFVSGWASNLERCSFTTETTP